jgi:hypothetical protein
MECMTCVGTGEVDCETCETSGKDPSGRYDQCEECTGIGSVECDGCDGEGQV